MRRSDSVAALAMRSLRRAASSSASLSEYASAASLRPSNVPDALGWSPVHHAASVGNVKRLRACLEVESDPGRRTQDSEQLSVLDLAARSGNPEAVRLCLAYGTGKLHANQRNPGNGTTALHQAARSADCADVLPVLIELGVDLDAEDDQGMTPMHYAVMHENVPALGALLREGASIHVRDASGSTLAHHAASIPNAVDSLRLLLECGLSADAQNRRRCTPLHMACLTGSTDAISLLLEYHCPISDRDLDGYTALHYAAMSLYDAAAKCELLLKHNAPILSDDEATRQTTPLHLACRNGNVATAEVLLQYGASMRAECEDGTPLEDAARNGHQACIRLLAAFGLNLDYVGGSGYAAIHAAAQAGNAAGVRALLALGASIDLVSSQGRSALDESCLNGSLDCVQTLLAAGADAQVPAVEGGLTPAHFAAQGDHRAILSVLLKAHPSAASAADASGRTLMHVAAASNACQALAYLLVESTTNANARDAMGRTPLHYAVQRACTDAASLLLNSSDIDVNVKDDAGNTILLAAVGSGSHDTVVALLEADEIDVDARGQDDLTALHVAAATGLPDIVRLLLRYDAQLDLVTARSGSTALHSAVRDADQHDDSCVCVKMLIDAGAPLSAVMQDQSNVLHLAAGLRGERGRAVMRTLLEQPQAAELLEARDAHQLTPLLVAAACGLVDAVRQLVDAGARTDVTSSDGNTVWHLAASHVDVLQYLLTISSSCAEDAQHCTNNAGATALVIAALAHKVDCVQQLLRAGWDPRHTDHAGCTLAHLLCQQGSDAAADVLQCIADVAPDTMAAQDEAGDTPLHHAAAAARAGTVANLLSNGAAVDAVNKRLYTPLQLAARAGNTSVLRVLLTQGGARPSLRSSNGWTALHEAIAHGHTDAADVLLRHGADVNAACSDQAMPLHLAARRSGAAPCVRLLLDFGAQVAATDSAGATPLHAAATPAIARMLLKAGAPVDAVDQDGWSPLAEAVLSSADVATVLVHHGADVQWRDGRGWTTLHHAAAAGRVDSLAVLLDRGVSVDATDRDGWTALHEAVLAGQQAAAEYLLHQGASASSVDESAMHGSQGAAQVRTYLEYAAQLLFDLQHGPEQAESIESEFHKVALRARRLRNRSVQRGISLFRAAGQAVVLQVRTARMLAALAPSRSVPTISVSLDTVLERDASKQHKHRPCPRVSTLRVDGSSGGDSSGGDGSGGGDATTDDAAQQQHADPLTVLAKDRRARRQSIFSSGEAPATRFRRASAPEGMRRRQSTQTPRPACIMEQGQHSTDNAADCAAESVDVAAAGAQDTRQAAVAAPPAADKEASGMQEKRMRVLAALKAVSETMLQLEIDLAQSKDVPYDQVVSRLNKVTESLHGVSTAPAQTPRSALIAEFQQIVKTDRLRQLAEQTQQLKEQLSCDHLKLLSLARRVGLVPNTRPRSDSRTRRRRAASARLRVATPTRLHDESRASTPTSQMEASVRQINVLVQQRQHDLAETSRLMQLLEASGAARSPQQQQYVLSQLEHEWQPATMQARPTQRRAKSARHVRISKRASSKAATTTLGTSVSRRRSVRPATAPVRPRRKTEHSYDDDDDDDRDDDDVDDVDDVDDDGEATLSSSSSGCADSPDHHAAHGRGDGVGVRACSSSGHRRARVQTPRVTRRNLERQLAREQEQRRLLVARTSFLTAENRVLHEQMQAMASITGYRAYAATPRPHTTSPAPHPRGKRASTASSVASSKQRRGQTARYHADIKELRRRYGLQ